MNAVAPREKIKIVFFAGEGRLGNQIIQYAALRKYFPSARINGFGFRAISELFETDFGGLNKVSDIILRRFVFPFLIAIQRVVPLYYVAYEGRCDSGKATGKMVVKDGLFNICICHRMYMQNFSTELSREDFEDFVLPNARVNRMLDFLSKNKMADTASTICLHVRRGDYLNFKTEGIDNVCLGADYYWSALDVLGFDKKSDNCVVVTDDEQWCKEVFSEIRNVHVYSMSQFDDFVLLSLFSKVVISNSTFSLCAAMLSKNAEKIVAPKHWFGRGVGRWAPANIEVINPAIK